ncbi:MAG TPA: zinc-binding dehydrogenase [Streptosporangiaceae bacterium]|nr:zinc-binding dehydrogenase [Streptosporangiaceae bacterium]
MRAAVVTSHGGPGSLDYGTAEVPQPPAGWMRVRVLACALNMLDVFVRRGMPGVHLDLPHTPGGDIVGVVDALGDGAAGPAPGTQVLVDPAVNSKALGEDLPGGLAEYVIAPAQNAIPLDVPAGQAPKYAALPIAYGTARRMLITRAGLAPGETVVVLGAAGGVGVACIQLGKALGARVIACSSSRAKLDELGKLGADELVDTSAGEFGAQVWNLTGRTGADVVVDYLGADTWPQSVRAVRRGGRLVTCGASTGFLAQTDLRYVWTRELSILGSDGWSREDLLELVADVRDGRLAPVIHRVYPLSRVREAIADVEERRAVGKVVVVPDAG